MGFQQAVVNECKRVNNPSGKHQWGTEWEIWQILRSANTSLIAIQVAVVSCGGSKQA
jgi:hypothetical protein